MSDKSQPLFSIATRPPEQLADEAAKPARLRQSFIERLKQVGRDELSMWRKAIFSPVPYVLLLVMAGLFALAWQVGFNYKIDPATEERHLDEPFLRGFHERENIKLPDGSLLYYRWSKQDETHIRFDGIGRGNYGFNIRLQADTNPNKDLTIYANETLVGYYKIQPGVNNYSVDIPATAMQGRSGDLDLKIVVPGYKQKGDNRDQLGYALMSAEIQARPSGVITPSLTQLPILLGVILLAYLIVARAGFKDWQAGGVAAVIGLVLVYMVATPTRPWLTIFSDKLAFAFGLSLLALVLLDLPMRLLWQKPWERSWVLAIFGLAMAVKLAGLLHPHIQIVDIGFHRNRFIEFWEQGHYFQKITSTEWGSRETYYPVTTYIFAGLFRWLIPDPILLLKVWMVLLESTRVLLAFYLVKRVTGDGRAGILAGFFMAVMPVNLISLAFGQVANLFGEWLLMVGLCMLVVKYDELRRPIYFVTFTALLLAAFLQHPGVILLSGSVFLLMPLFMKGNRLVVLAAYAIALVLSIALYHHATLQDMVPQAIQTFQAKLSGTAVPGDIEQRSKGIFVGGSVRDARLGLQRTEVKNFGAWLGGGLGGFWTEARVYFNLLPVLMIPFAMLWLWRTGSTKRPSEPLEPDDDDKKRATRRRLFWACAVWLAVGVGFALIGWSLNLYVRYSLFLLPVVAIAGGIFLSRLCRRTGRVGMVLTLAICAYFLITFLALYYDRLVFASSMFRK